MINTRQRPLTALEQLIMDHIWTRPGSTAEDCREAVAANRRLKDSTIRTILRKLEEKGYVTHRIDGRTFVYSPAETRRNVAVGATRQLIDRFLNGSVEELVVGLVDQQVLDPRQLETLARKIASAKEREL